MRKNTPKRERERKRNSSTVIEKKGKEKYFSRRQKESNIFLVNSSDFHIKSSGFSDRVDRQLILSKFKSSILVLVNKYDPRRTTTGHLLYASAINSDEW